MNSYWACFTTKILILRGKLSIQIQSKIMASPRSYEWREKQTMMSRWRPKTAFSATSRNTRKLDSPLRHNSWAKSATLNSTSLITTTSLTSHPSSFVRESKLMTAKLWHSSNWTRWCILRCAGIWKELVPKTKLTHCLTLRVIIFTRIVIAVEMKRPTKAVNALRLQSNFTRWGRSLMWMSRQIGVRPRLRPVCMEQRFRENSISPLRERLKYQQLMRPLKNHCRASDP